MGYNWKEKFKNKSNNELYDIYLGLSYQVDNAMYCAEQELKSRNFDFNKESKDIKKWELENIYKEERDERNSFFNRKPSVNHYIIMVFSGLLLTVVSLLNLIFDFIDFLGKNILGDKYFLVLIGIVFSIFGYFGYKNRKKIEKERKDKIESLINEI